MNIGKIKAEIHKEILEDNEVLIIKTNLRDNIEDLEEIAEYLKNEIDKSCLKGRVLFIDKDDDYIIATDSTKTSIN